MMANLWKIGYFRLIPVVIFYVFFSLLFFFLFGGRGGIQTGLVG